MRVRETCALNITVQGTSQRVTRTCTRTHCATSVWSFYCCGFSIAPHRAMLLGESRAKQLAGPTKPRSSGRFAMHILDLNEKQTGLTQVGRRILGIGGHWAKTIGLTCKCKLIFLKLQYRRYMQSL